MKGILLSGTLAALFLLAACQNKPETAGANDEASAAVKLNNWKNAGCELISDAEVQTLFDVDPQRDALNSRSLPEQTFCLRTWNKPDWKEREENNEKPGAAYLEPRNRLILQIFDYKSETIATQQFNMLKRDRRDTYEENVSGLGDDAIWSTQTVTLLAKKGHLVLSISLEYSDTPHDNLAKAKEVAALALKKMEQ